MKIAHFCKTVKMNNGLCAKLGFIWKSKTISRLKYKENIIYMYI